MSYRRNGIHSPRVGAGLAALVLLLLLPAGVKAARVDLAPVADTTLIEAAPNANLGGACIVNSGTTFISTRNRGLFQFDLSGLPVGTIVNNVELVLSVTGEPGSGFIAANYSLHRMLRPWGEGDKGDPNCPPEIGSSPGLGAPATSGEATWTHRFALTTDTWGAPGGAAGIDFAAPSSGEQIISGTGDSPYYFNSSPGLNADVQSWINNPQDNFGWMLLCDSELERGTARRFASREDVSNTPILIVEYTVVPEQGTLAFLGLAATSLFLLHCHRQA